MNSDCICKECYRICLVRNSDRCIRVIECIAFISKFIKMYNRKIITLSLLEVNNGFS
jgi:hypothetical protein